MKKYYFKKKFLHALLLLQHDTEWPIPNPTTQKPPSVLFFNSVLAGGLSIKKAESYYSHSPKRGKFQTSWKLSIFHSFIDSSIELRLMLTTIFTGTKSF